MRLVSSLSFLSSSVSFPRRALLFHFSKFATSSRLDEISRNAKVSVWWDFENCGIPAGIDVSKIAYFITAALKANDIKGPVRISAFGDVLQLSRVNQVALFSSGIILTQVPNGGKNSADISILADIYDWVSQNPPPAHLFLISGDGNFACFLHRFRMNNYNVLLASPESAHSTLLCGAASITWHWHALIRGENLVGSHFKQPPDAPYGSWYDHFNAQPSSLRAEEVSESNSDPKFRPIPKTVIREIHNILKLYPKGLLLTELRSELGKGCVSIDRDFYGYKKFSSFLLSMPHILKLQTMGDGQFAARLVTPRWPKKPLESSRGISDNGTEGHDPNLPNLPSNPQDKPLKVKPSSKLGKSIGEPMEGEPSTCLVSEPHAIGDSKPTSKFEVDSTMPPSNGQHSKAILGFFRRIWRRLLGNNGTNSENESLCISEKCSTPDDSLKQKNCSDSLGEAKTEGRTANPICEDANSVHQVSNSHDLEPAKLQKEVIVSSAYDDKSSPNPGLLSTRNWFKSWGRSTENSEVQCEQNQLKKQSGQHHLFTNNSFWQDMQSFMETPKGVAIISQSKTRSEIAQNLLVEGPPVLKSLSTCDLFNVLELLISDKKWVEECSSETNPFRLTLSIARKSSCTKPLHRANKLTSIFMNEKSQCSIQGSREHDSDLDKKNENIPQDGSNTTMSKSMFPDRVRCEILGDCQKLVDEILRDHPDGYNIGAFRGMFLEKYGYHLDLKKLGYHKLTSLLQIIPGVSIVSTFIVPTNKAPKVSKLETNILSDPEKNMFDVKANFNNESSDLSRKEDDFESVWEELGPACTDSGSVTTEVAEEKPKAYYEPALSEDESTETDGESCPTPTTEVPAKQQTNEDKSSLIQILDAWHRSKEDSWKDKTENNLKLSSLAPKNEADSGSFGRKQRYQKSYSFVSDSAGKDQVKLIDEVLGTLKKSSEPQIHN